MQFRGTPHNQFEKSHHNQRVIFSPCVDDGMFVYATKDLLGFVGPEWSILPNKLDVLYRKVVTAQTFQWFLADPDDGHAVEWLTATRTITRTIHPIHNTIDITIEGSLNETQYTKILNLLTGAFDTFTLNPDDYLTENPYPTFGYDQDTAVDFPGGTGGFTLAEDAYVKTITAVGTGTTTCEIVWFDHPASTNTEISPSIFTETITCSEPFNPDNAGDDAVEMLATLPLQRANQSLSNVLVYNFPDYSLETGYVGMASTQQLPYYGNLISLEYRMMSYGDLRLTLVAACDGANTSDSMCEGRLNTFTPAARSGSDFATGVPGDGTLYEVGPGSGGAPSDAGIIAITAHGYAKKSLLTRTTADDWTIFVPYDSASATYLPDDATCLGGLGALETTECKRYYYPSGADLGGSGSTCVNFTFGSDGIIYREIPIDISAIDPCPTGLLGFTNPCA